MKKPQEMFNSKARYGELLADRRWKNFSAAIRAKGGACELCGARNKTTQVHHWFYDGRAPWEYRRDEVAVVCTDCHVKAHAFLEAFRRTVFPILRPQDYKPLLISLVTCITSNRIDFAFALLGLAENQGTLRALAEKGRRLIESDLKIYQAYCDLLKEEQKLA